MDNLWLIYGSGWWYTYPSEKYEFVNWDDDIPNIWENKHMFQTTNQKSSVGKDSTMEHIWHYVAMVCYDYF